MKHKILPFITGCLIVLTMQIAKSQNNNNSIEVTPFTGLQTFSAEGNGLTGKPWGAEVAYHLNMAANQADWVRLLGINDVNISLSYRDLQSISLSKQPGTGGFLGNYFGAVGRLDFILAQWGKTKFLLQPGMGFGYATQTYYTNNNPLVGSHINFTAQIGLKLSTPITNTTRLLLGADLYHFSNAAMKLPNDGINSINASAGIEQDIDRPAPKTTENPFKHYSRHSFEFGFNIGRRGLVQSGGGFDQHPEYAAYQKAATSNLYQSGIYLGYSYRVNPVLSLRLGTDAVYYYKTLDTIPGINHFYATYQELGSSYDKLRVGTSIGTELWLGRVSFTANVGYYLHFHYFAPTYGYTDNPPKYYWTFGARYYLSPWVAIEAKQYLHRTQADFAGFGLLFKVK